MKTRRRSVRCPVCNASSHVEVREFGNEHRRCRKGHWFQYDKWMAERFGTALLFGLLPHTPPPERRTR